MEIHEKVNNFIPILAHRKAKMVFPLKLSTLAELFCYKKTLFPQKCAQVNTVYFLIFSNYLRCFVFPQGGTCGTVVFPWKSRGCLPWHRVMHVHHAVPLGCRFLPAANLPFFQQGSFGEIGKHCRFKICSLKGLSVQVR